MGFVSNTAPKRGRSAAMRKGPRGASLALLSLALVCAPALAIVGGTPTNAFGVVGEGVQFAPNWVLTAGHLGYTANATTFSNGHGSSLVDAVYTPVGGGTFPFNDLKLVHLKDAISAAPVVQLSSTLWSDTAFALANPSLNINVTIATNSTQAPRGYAFAQLREFATSAQVDTNPDPLVTNLQVGTVNWLVTHQNSFAAPYVQGGDSGGGLFLGHVTDSTSPLLGITSALLPGINGANTAASAFVSVAKYRAWIDATMILDTQDSQMAVWTATPVPEPATWAMWLAGAAAMTVAKRRNNRKG